MKKRGYIIIIAIILLGILVGIGRGGYDIYKQNKLVKHVIEEYGFEISYPKTYKDIIKESGDQEDKILSNVTVKESGEQISEYMQNLNMTETVKDLRNELTGMKIIVEAINTEKTKLDIEEICKRYVVMFQIYNEEKVIRESHNESVTIDGKVAGKVTIKVKGEKEDSILIAYLMPLEDKEITVTFIGSESMINRAEKEISKIINSLKVY